MKLLFVLFLTQSLSLVSVAQTDSAKLRFLMPPTFEYLDNREPLVTNVLIDRDLTVDGQKMSLEEYKAYLSKKYETEIIPYLDKVYPYTSIVSTRSSDYDTWLAVVTLSKDELQSQRVLLAMKMFGQSVTKISREELTQIKEHLPNFIITKESQR